MLGVASGKKRLLLQFDPVTLSFKELKLPQGCEVPPMLMEDLQLPQGCEIYNYSNMVAVGPDKFLVCGGITADLQSITAKCFMLEPLTGKLEGIPPMH